MCVPGFKIPDDIDGRAHCLRGGIWENDLPYCVEVNNFYMRWWRHKHLLAIVLNMKIESLVTYHPFKLVGRKIAYEYILI